MASRYFQAEKQAYCKTCQNILTTERHGFRSGLYCRRCNKFRDDEDVLYKWKIACPHCGKQLFFTETGEKDLTCPDCLHILHRDDDEVTEVECRLDPGAVNEQIRETYLVFRHPSNEFCSDTHIVPEAGTSCLCVQGETITPATADCPMPFAGQPDSRPVTASVFYVRNVVSHVFTCGTLMPVFVHTDTAEADVRFAVECEVRVKNAATFLKWLGSRSCTVDQLVNGDNMLPNLDREVLNSFQDSAGNAVNLAVARYQIGLRDLQANHDGVRLCLIEEMSHVLEKKGLTVSSCSFVTFDVAMRGRNADPIKDRIERLVDWVCPPVRIHEKEKPEYWAEVTLGGNGRIRLRDLDRLMSTGEGNRWISENTDPGTAAKELGEDMGRQLHAVFQQLLQKMINDVGAGVDDIVNFLPYLQGQVGEFLNSPGGLLETRGLSVENLSIQVRRREKSQLLSRRENVVTEIRSTDIDEELRRYQDQLTITRARDASQVRIELRRIQQEEDQA